MGSYNRYLSSVSKYIRAKYPVRKLRKSINLSLGYFLTLVSLERKKILSRQQVCMLFKESLFFECVQINPEVFDLILFSGYLVENRKDLDGYDRYEYECLCIWLEEIAMLYSPERSGI